MMHEDQRSDGSMWDRRFAETVYAYGKEPNAWLKTCIGKLSPEPNPAALFPADGEGRNAVWAACEGWSAMVFDLSIEGKKKCEQYWPNADGETSSFQKSPEGHAIDVTRTAEVSVTRVDLLIRCVVVLSNSCTSFGRLYHLTPYDFVRKVVKQGWTERHFTITERVHDLLKHTRHVQQFHFTAWPDRGVPTSPDKFLQYLHVLPLRCVAIVSHMCFA